MFGLSASTVASAFGKVGVQNEKCEFADADVARALLEMIGQNIAQLAYLCARRYHLTRILFCGNFLRNNRLSMGSISYAIDYWSHSVQKALFMLHEGYFGAMGAFFLQDEHPWQPDIVDPMSSSSRSSNPRVQSSEDETDIADLETESLLKSLTIDNSDTEDELSMPPRVSCTLRTPPSISPLYRANT